MSNDGFSFEDCVNLMKCFNVSRKRSMVIQPVLLANPSVFGGAPFTISVLKCTVGNTMTGGNACPLAPTIQHVVTLSAGVAVDTWCAPVCARTFEVPCTVHVAVSSRLYTLDPFAKHSLRSYTVFRVL
uniref:Uncharacterized protein n=1 Tax=Cacopsylla melanoneura TaxID=428564 RepID=A0A8D9A9R0_9HEMI